MIKMAVVHYLAFNGKGRVRVVWYDQMDMKTPEQELEHVFERAHNIGADISSGDVVVLQGYICAWMCQSQGWRVIQYDEYEKQQEQRLNRS